MKTNGNSNERVPNENYLCFSLVSAGMKTVKEFEAGVKGHSNILESHQGWRMWENSKTDGAENGVCKMGTLPAPSQGRVVSSQNG